MNRDSQEWKESYPKLLEACRALPPAHRDYLDEDYVRNLMRTVLDPRMQTAMVAKAIEHFNAQWQDRRPTLDDLEAILARFPDDHDGNVAMAQELWGYKHWTRAAMLRHLVEFFKSIGVTDEPSLRSWAQTASFADDFEGRVEGLGPTSFQWLVMRQGLERLRPDGHLHRFVKSVLDHEVTAADLVSLLTAVADELKLKPYDLDWRIWENERWRPKHPAKATE